MTIAAKTIATVLHDHYEQATDLADPVRAELMVSLGFVLGDRLVDHHGKTSEERTAFIQHTLRGNTEVGDGAFTEADIIAVVLPRYEVFSGMATLRRKEHLVAFVYALADALMEPCGWTVSAREVFLRKAFGED